MKISQLDPRKKLKQRFISPIKNHCSPAKIGMVSKFSEPAFIRPAASDQSKIRKICSLNP